MRDLSILIPARNEMFLQNTVEDILKNKRGNTEVLVGLDGETYGSPVLNHPDVTVIKSNVSIGQRAMTNQLCRLSKAKYVMKLDAHCAFDEGFDTKLIADMKDDYTMLPMMYNLHAFDWVCKLCGNRTYQGPTPEKCFKEGCTGIPERQITWERRKGTGNYCYYFDTSYHFQYHSARKHHPENEGKQIVETMSAQGSCFMLTRQKYWELNICDEEFGSWGQQGFEVAMKTWMSGGRLVSNKNTWYAHMFRTQGKDFGFPYQQSQRQIDHARKLSKELVEKNNWPHAVHDFNWLLDKFKPVPTWHDEQVSRPAEKQSLLKRGIIYYTDNAINLNIGVRVQRQIKSIGLPIVSASLKPMPSFGKNIHITRPRGFLTMAIQILTALENSDADIVYFCEHDVLYHPSHFDFIPPEKDKYYYNTNVWRVRRNDGHALYCDNLQQLSGLVGYRTTLIEHYRKRVLKLQAIEADNTDYRNIEIRKMGFEPGTNNRAERIDDLKAESYFSKYPNLDIRHEGNLTPSRWRKDQFRNEKYIQGWKESTLDKIPSWNLSLLALV